MGEKMKIQVQKTEKENEIIIRKIDHLGNTSEDYISSDYAILRKYLSRSFTYSTTSEDIFNIIIMFLGGTFSDGSVVMRLNHGCLLDGIEALQSSRFEPIDIGGKD